MVTASSCLEADKDLEAQVTVEHSRGLKRVASVLGPASLGLLSLSSSLQPGPEVRLSTSLAPGLEVKVWGPGQPLQAVTSQ